MKEAQALAMVRQMRSLLKNLETLDDELVKRVQVGGDERYHDVPNKNRYSHPCEAVQYVMLGGGEGRVVMRQHNRPKPNNPPRADKGTYSPHAW